MTWTLSDASAAVSTSSKHAEVGGGDTISSVSNSSISPSTYTTNRENRENIENRDVYILHCKSQMFASFTASSSLSPFVII